MADEPGTREEVERPVVAVRFKVTNHQRTVGIAVRQPRQRRSLEDRVSWTLMVYEFLDNDQFSNLDTLVLQLAPHSCLITLDGNAAKGRPRGDMAKLMGVMERHDAEVTDAKSSLFRADDLGQQLRVLLGEEAALAQHNLTQDMPLGSSCVSCLITALGLTSGGGDEEGDGQGEGGWAYELKHGNLGAHMRLDSAAAAAATLLPDPSSPHQFGSLYQVLNRCKTKMGGRLLEHWLRQPLTDKLEIEGRQDMVGLLKDEAGLRSGLQDGPLRACPDLDLLKTKMQRKKAGLPEVFKMYVFARGLLSFVGVFESHLQ
ncbi:unnamed protein product, partial [Discosporangium mesarthrocarpum]